MLPNPRFVALVVACLLSAAALAADVIAEGPTVRVNGMTVMRLRTDSGVLPPNVRASTVAAHLDAIDSGNFQARVSGEAWFVTVNGRTLLEVTQTEARAQNTSPEKLARQWASNLTRAYSLPALDVPVGELLVPVGAEKGVAILGYGAPNAQITSSAPDVAEFEHVTGGIRVRGLRPGYASIVIRSGVSREQVDVTVRAAAATLPQTLDAAVSGAPATRQAVLGSIEYVLRTHLERQPNASVQFGLPDAAALPAAQAGSYNVRVRVNAPGALESVGYVKVNVRNEPLPKTQDDELWYCNQPEIVKTAQNLFAADLKRNVSARMLYHHINAATSPLIFRIQAVNETDVPARIQVFAGDAEPHRDPVKAGLDAGNRYLRSWMVGSGQILTIPARSAIPISIRRVSPKETMSGLCSIRLLDGPDSLRIRTDSLPSFALDERWSRAVASHTPWVAVGANPITSYDRAPSSLSSLIFPNPYKTEAVGYEVGGRHGVVRIGQRPISRSDLALNLDGNFGVIYSIKANLENSTARETEVELVFEASAGYSGGLFLVNGTLIQTPLLKPKQEARVAKFRLIPGAKRDVNITTVPLSGSSYPATLTLRAVHSVALQHPTDRKNR